MQALVLFQDPSFQVPWPDCMRQEDVEGVDPNEEERFSIPRDVKWFIQTWKHYLKKKYKTAIGRWDKETGGGSREPEEFADYCDKSSRWLVWVYLLDIERDFLLFSNAKGKPPEYVGTESGFPQSTDFDTDQESNAVGSGRKRKSTHTGKQSAQKARMFEDRTNTLTNLMQDISSVLKAHAPCPSLGEAHDEVGTKLLNAMIHAGERREEMERCTRHMSPGAKACVLNKIDSEIHNLGQQYKEHDAKLAFGPHDESPPPSPSPPTARRLMHRLESSSSDEED